ncbi:MAG: L-rhamnonate dehydratase [Acidobacteriaceae bacterium]|nr:L-rhamnonate dehydratase [Acidobacteriaceae bacterium]
MKVSRMDVWPIRLPTGQGVASKGEFLVTPLHIFENYQQLLGEGFVGLRGGPVGAVIVVLHTDDGLQGVGSVGVGNGSALYILEHSLKPVVLGANPFDVEALWEQMYRGTLYFGRKGVALEAISAVDIALWDLMGKAAGQPVYNLLGGRTRERIRVYASRLYANENLPQLAGEAQAFVRQGFTFLKQRFGFGPRDGIVGMRKNLALVKTVRDAVGPDVEIAADCYMGWDVSYAIRMIRAIEDAGVNLAWVEEPVIPDDIAGYAQVRRAVQTPISGGEHEFTRYGFRQLIDAGAVDILQPDVNRAGGITEARKIWALAATYGLRVIPHSGQAHNYHLVMSHMNSPVAEYFPSPAEGAPLDDDTLFWDVFDGEPLAVNGHVTLSGKPGLGLELKADRLRALVVV